MSLVTRFARPSRRRRRVDVAVKFSSPLDLLESRQLMTVAAVSPAFDLHAQYLRFEQLNGLMTTSTHHQVTATVTHVAATHALATAKSTHRTHASTTVTKPLQFNDFRKITASVTADQGDGSQATYAPVVGALTPTQVRTAYGVSALSTSNQGQGTTIAIIDELDDANITSDASVYSAQYNLPQFDGLNGDPTFKVIKDTDLGTVATAVGSGVAGETSLDVEIAHAMAPKANIVLVEVPATGTVANEFVELLEGVQYAAKLPGVDVVSLSYGYPEANIGATNVTAQDATYLATGAASTVAVTVSSGDGSTPLFPATSPNVIAVGGTSLYLSGLKGKYGYETAWGGLPSAGAGGGGLSTNFSAPTFQSGNNVIYTKRAIPDVSLIADPYTGISYYDTLDVTASAPDPWGDTGGTSVAAPVFAGMLDLAQQNRLAAGKAILTSTQINADIYSLYNSASYSTYFRDIVLGSNKNVSSSGRTTVTGYTATTGYDLATGVGSPIGNTFVPQLSSL